MTADSANQSLQAFYDKQKETHGGWATFAWIGSGIYLFATTEGVRFLSWQAAAFFLVGTFVAALVFGIAGYVVQRGLAKAIMGVFPSPSTGVATVAVVLGWLLFAAETVVIFLVARWMISRMV